MDYWHLACRRVRMKEALPIDTEVELWDRTWKVVDIEDDPSALYVSSWPPGEYRSGVVTIYPETHVVVLMPVEEA